MDYYKKEIYVYIEVNDSKCCSKNMFGFSMFQHPNKAMEQPKMLRVPAPTLWKHLTQPTLMASQVHI